MVALTPVQRYRSDPDRKLFENKLRLLRGVADGAVPRPRSLEKYDIGVDEVDAIRARNNLPRLFAGEGALATTTATLLEINKMTQERIVEKAREKSLLETIEEDTNEVRRLTAQVEKDFADKIVDIPQGEAFSAETISLYFQKLYGFYEQFPSGTGRAVVGKPQKETTVALRWGKYGQVAKGVCARLFKDTPFAVDTRGALKPGFIRQFLDDIPIRRPQLKSTSSLLSHVDVIGLMLRDYPPYAQDRAYDDSRTILGEYRDALKTRQTAEGLTKVRDQKLKYTFTDMMKMAANKTTGDKDFHLYLKIFNEFPSRDDFGRVKVITESEDRPIGEENRVNEGYNYLIVPTNRRLPLTFVLVNYKTVSKYGIQRFDFSSLLSRELRAFVKDKEYLFGRGASMSIWVNEKLKKLGIKQPGDEGAINLLRHSLITELMGDSPNMTAEQRTELANRFKHSPGTAMAYVRSFADDQTPTLGKRKADADALPGRVVKK